MKASSAQAVSCCNCDKPKINYAALAWQLYIHVWLWDWSGYSAPSTKELHGLWYCPVLVSWVVYFLKADLVLNYLLFNLKPRIYYYIATNYAASGQWLTVVAQLEEWSLPTPEVRGSNPVIGEILFMYSLSTVLKNKIKLFEQNPAVRSPCIGYYVQAYA